MMGSLGGGGNVSFFFLGAVMGDGRCNFSFLFSMGTITNSVRGFSFGVFFFLGRLCFYTSEAQDDTHQRSERLSLCFDFSLSFSLSLVALLRVIQTDWNELWARWEHVCHAFCLPFSQRCAASRRFVIVSVRCLYRD
jgi:hypothetical protein